MKVYALEEHGGYYYSGEDCQFWHQIIGIFDTLEKAEEAKSLSISNGYDDNGTDDEAYHHFDISSYDLNELVD